MLWSRPEHRAQAGKILVAGGHAQGFAAVAGAYAALARHGAGSVRAVVPDALRKTLGRVFEAGVYAPSSPAGSFSREALATLLDEAAWADGVLLAGDFGRGSETAIMLESFVGHAASTLCLHEDSLDAIQAMKLLTDRPATVIVASFSQMQRMFTEGKSATPLTTKLDLLHIVAALHDFSLTRQCTFVMPHDRTIYVAAGGRVGTTRYSVYDMPANADLAAAACVWATQQPARLYEALMCATLPVTD